MSIEIQELVRERFERLRYMSMVRNGLQSLRRLSSNQGYVPIVRSIASHVYNDAKLEDLKRANSILGGLFKMGLGNFGFQNPSKPGDHPVVIIFVVGGVTLVEIKQIIEEVKSQSPWKPQILLGGTFLLSSSQVTKLMWR